MNIKRSILLPFVVGSVVLFLVLLVSTHFEEHGHIADDFAHTRNDLGAVFDLMLGEHAAALSIELEHLSRDDRLVEAFLARDRKRLLELSEGRFEALYRDFDVTHFYFHGPDRVNFLRVHQPDRYGDFIDRFTALRAEREDRLVYGAELGPLGTFTLRAVMPWRHEGRLIGYLELGKEVEGITSRLAEMLHLELAVLVEKRFLAREDWEKGNHMLHRHSHWDLMPEEVLATRTDGLMPEEMLRDIAATLAAKPEEAAHVPLGGREYFIGAIPLIDAGARRVGRMLVMADRTERVSRMYGVLGTMAGASALVGPLLLGLFYLVLNRAERQVAAWRQRFDEESNARLQMQQNHIRQLEHAALYDPLTGLANRRLLNEQLTVALECARHEDHGLALVLLNLQRIGEINATLGHDTGDTALKLAADRLRTSLPHAFLVARAGGDEFAVVWPTADAKEAVDAVFAALSVPFHIGSIVLDLITNVGVSLFPDHGEDAVTLLRRADVAMRQAKRKRNHAAIYDVLYDPYSVRRLTLLGELRKAIQDKQVKLHFQPIVNLSDESVSAVEALARWTHPQLGEVPPDEFVPMAEQTGLIKSLTRLVIDQALGHQAAWRAAGHDISVSVNLSAHDLTDENLPDYLGRCLEEWQGRAERVIFELTEGTVMREPELSLSVLRRFAAMGVPLAIDDFGTGYSSLAYLKRMPVAELKVDRSFVKEMCTDPSDATIVASTIGLAHTLGLTVVAEGVEDRATWEALCELGCDAVQGYYIGRPISAEAFIAWYEKASENLRQATPATASTLSPEGTG